MMDEFYDYLSAFSCIIVIIVNSFVIISSGFLLHRGQQPRATYIYLGNISLSDMIIGITSLFIIAFPHQFHNELMCSISISLALTASLASGLGIGLIAIDRYLYILYGLHYHRYITTQHCHCMVALLWLVSALFGFVPIFLFRSPMEGQVCYFIVLVPVQFALLNVFLGVIPMVLIFVLYSIILKNALSSMSRNCAPVNNLENHARDLRMSRGQEQITSNCENDALPYSRVRSFGLFCCRRYSSTFAVQSTFCENKWKAVKIVAFTTGAFFITWFPSFVTWIIYAHCDLKTNYQHCKDLEFLLTCPLSFLSLVNSLLDPLIYAWWHQGFRESVKKMYSMLLRKLFKQPLTSPSPEPKILHTSSIKRIEQDENEPIN